MNIDYKLQPITDKNVAAYFHDLDVKLLNQKYHFHCKSLHLFKALANEDTLPLRTHRFLMMLLGLRKLGNICCGHKMCLNKIKNSFCVPDTKFVSATNVARAGRRGNVCVGNNVSATMCPRFPGPLGFITTCEVKYICKD